MFELIECDFKCPTVTMCAIIWSKKIFFVPRVFEVQMRYNFNQNITKYPKENEIKKRVKIFLINTLTRLFVFILSLYFPMQKLANILPSNSSLET